MALTHDSSTKLTYRTVAVLKGTVTQEGAPVLAESGEPMSDELRDAVGLAFQEMGKHMDESMLHAIFMGYPEVELTRGLESPTIDAEYQVK